MRRRDYARFFFPVCMLDNATLPESVAASASNPSNPALELDANGSLLLMPTAQMLDHAAAIAAPLFDPSVFDTTPLDAEEEEALTTAIVVAGLLDTVRAQREILRRLALDPTNPRAQWAAKDYLSNGLAVSAERGTVSLVKIDIRNTDDEQAEALEKIRLHAKRTRARAERATRDALRDLNPSDDGGTVIPFPNEATTDV